MVVNNNAAAVLLVLAALAAGRAVPVSRGESVEIGGGFRVPEVMEQSGARLVDVGTTNRTRLADYRRAARPPRRRRARSSRCTPATTAWTASSRRRASPSWPRSACPSWSTSAAGCSTPPARGCPAPHPPAWLAGEPAARQTLAAGAALVTFSGDKLLGGPQAGIIAGRADLVDRCARHPLARALRPGGLVLAALQDVALAYLRRDVVDRVPFWRMATTPVDVLAGRARALAAPDRRRGAPDRGRARRRLGARHDDPVVGRRRRRRPPRRVCGPTTRRCSPGHATGAPCSTCAPSTRPTTTSSPPPSVLSFDNGPIGPWLKRQQPGSIRSQRWSWAASLSLARPPRTGIGRRAQTGRSSRPRRRPARRA